MHPDNNYVAMVGQFLKEEYRLLMLLAFYVLLCLTHAYSFVGGGSRSGNSVCLLITDLLIDLTLTEVTLFSFLTV